MARYKVIAQIYRSFEFEAPSQADAMRMAEEALTKEGVKDPCHVNHAKDLDKPKHKKVIKS